MSERSNGLGKAMHLWEDVYYYVRKDAIAEDKSVGAVANAILKDYYTDKYPKQELSVAVDEKLMQDIQNVANELGVTLQELVEQNLAKTVRKNLKLEK